MMVWNCQMQPFLYAWTTAYKAGDVMETLWRHGLRASRLCTGFFVLSKQRSEGMALRNHGDHASNFLFDDVYGVVL
jgi:hypothetical protein